MIRLHVDDVELGPGQMYIVPAGVEHQPVTIEPSELLLLERSGTPNTGNIETAAPRIEFWNSVAPRCRTSVAFVVPATPDGHERKGGEPCDPLSIRPSLASFRPLLAEST